MKHRSPILGYNHNIRYGGRQYHVQTEDSGVNNPHIFTHLFHAGTILSSKRCDYPPADEESAVQRLMQAQHKAMLRDLKDGMFDIKIAQFFGERISARRSLDPDEQPPASADANGAATAIDTDGGSVPGGATIVSPIDPDTDVTDRDMGDVASAAEALAFDISLPDDVTPLPPTAPPQQAPITHDTLPVPRIELEPRELEPAPPTARRSTTPARGTRLPFAASPPAMPPSLPPAMQPNYAAPARPVPSDPPRLRSAFDLPPPTGSALGPPPSPFGNELADPPHLHYTPARVSAVPPAVPRPAHGVVVTRSVVVGAGQGPHTAPPPPRRPAPPPTPFGAGLPPTLARTAPPAVSVAPPQHANDSSIFGEDPYTDKSLDEVILAYLAEDSEK